MSEEELDSETLVFRQIDRVMRTASLDLENLTDAPSGITDTKTWSHRVLFSSEFLHAFLRPSMTEEESEEILDNAELTDNQNEADKVFRRVRYAKNLFREDMKHLHKNNMVFQESDDLIIEDDTEPKLEPEDSKVEEEVIE